MRNLVRLLETIYYYLKVSYKIWRVKRVKEDDLVYITKKNVQIGVYPGKKTGITLRFHSEIQGTRQAGTHASSCSLDCRNVCQACL